MNKWFWAAVMLWAGTTVAVVAWGLMSKYLF